MFGLQLIEKRSILTFMKRERIQSDFEKRTDTAGKEYYHYAGPLYELPRRRSLLAAVWGLPLLGLCVFVAMGLVSGPVSRRMWVMLPYVLLAAPLVMLIGDAYKVTLALRGPVRRAEHERGFLQLRRFAVAGTVLGIGTLATALIHMALQGTFASEWSFALGAAALTAIFSALTFIVEKIPVAERTGRDGEMEPHSREE